VNSRSASRAPPPKLRRGHLSPPNCFFFFSFLEAPAFFFCFAAPRWMIRPLRAETYVPSREIPIIPIMVGSRLSRLFFEISLPPSSPQAHRGFWMLVTFFVFHIRFFSIHSTSYCFRNFCPDLFKLSRPSRCISRFWRADEGGSRSLLLPSDAPAHFLFT